MVISALMFDIIRIEKATGIIEIIINLLKQIIKKSNNIYLLIDIYYYLRIVIEKNLTIKKEITMKKVMNIKEVQVAREENLPKIFNMVAALEAVKVTPAKLSRSGAKGDFSADIVEIFKAAGTPLATNQVMAAYNAGRGTSLDSKKFSDRCWILSDKNPKQKNPSLKAGTEKGMYELA